MKITSFLLLLLLSLSGCLYPRKMNKWVAKKYPDAQYKQPKPKPEYVRITSPLQVTDLKSSTTKQRVVNFLPLLVWWQYDCINTCTLNPNIALNLFNSALQTYARSKNVEQKLNGQTLSLSIDEIPNTFQLVDKGRLIFPIVGWNKISLTPTENALTVSWTLSGANGATTSGTTTVTSTYKGLPVRLFQPLRGTTLKYLDEYEADLKRMAKQTVEQIVTTDAPAMASLQ